MDSDIIRIGNETDTFSLSITKIVKRSLNKHIQNHKKRLNLSLPNLKKLSHLNHQYRLRVVG